MRSLTVSILIICCLVACIDRVELPIRHEEPRLVIEGQITNEVPPYMLRLTYTGPFGLTGDQRPQTPVVSGAQVMLTDDRGRSVRFADRTAGVYQTTDMNFRGEIGRTYKLTVLLPNGKRYETQPEQMPDVPPIDSISARVVQVNNLGYSFSYAVNLTDPAGQRNFYRWTAYGLTTRTSTGVPCSLGSTAICNNRCYTTVSSENINVMTDDAFNGNPLRNRFVLQLPIYSIWPQFMEVQQYGITQTNYQFWQLYRQQGARSGSIFDPLPAPVTGNLVNTADATDRARGYFAVTSVKRFRFRYDNFNVPNYTAIASYLLSLPIPVGDCRNTYGPVPIMLPPGW